MPDWAYYQQIDKPDWLKVKEQKDKMRQQASVEEQVKEAVDAALKDFFEGLR